MTAHDLLAVWRHRWGKDADVLGNFPFFKGSFYTSMQKFARAPSWEFGVLGPILGLLCTSLFAFLLFSDFQRNALITLVALLLATAIVFSAFHGTIAKIALVIVATATATLYLAWRAGSFSGLPHGFQLGLAVAIVSVEACGFFYLLMGWFAKIWPVTEPLGESAGAIDTVQTDHVLLVADLDEDEVLQYLRFASMLELDDVQCNMHVLDGQFRQSLADECLNVGIQYLVYEAQRGDSLAAYRLAMRCGDGDFVLLTGNPRLMLHGLLLKLVPWFLSSPGLTIAHTPDYKIGRSFEAGKVKAMAESQCAEGFAFVRRASWSRFGDGSNEGAVSRQELLKLRHETSLILADIEVGGDDFVIEPDLLRIARPYAWLSMRMRDWIAKVRPALSLYQAVPSVLVALVAPLFLLGGFNTFPGHIENPFIFGLPYICVLILVERRLGSDARIGTIRWLSETAIAVAVCVGAIRSCMRTVFTQFSLFTTLSLGIVRRDLLDATHWVVAVICNFLAIVVAFEAIFSAHPDRRWVFGFYAVWAALVVGWCICRLAVELELATVERTIQAKQKIGCSVVSARNRTHRGLTQNFPDAVISVALLGADQLHIGEKVRVLLGEETHVPLHATLTEKSANGLLLELAEDSRAQFEEIKEKIMSRDTNWPLWLPSETADQPLPAWVGSFYEGASTFLVDFFTNPKKYLSFSQLIGRFKK